MCAWLRVTALSGLGVLAREVAVARILTLPHPPTEIEPSRRVHRSRRTEERGPIRSAAGCRHLVQTHTFCFMLFLRPAAASGASAPLYTTLHNDKQTNKQTTDPASFQETRPRARSEEVRPPRHSTRREGLSEQRRDFFAGVGGFVVPIASTTTEPRYHNCFCASMHRERLGMLFKSGALTPLS